MSELLTPCSSVGDDVTAPFSQLLSRDPMWYPQHMNTEVTPMRRVRDEPLERYHFVDGGDDLQKEYTTRCLYTQSGRSKRLRLEKTLFEVLPIDVCSRIAAYLTCGKPTQDALHLAEASPHLRNAVLATLSYKYVCVNSWYYSQDIVKRWAVVFRDDLEDLTILQPRCSDRDAYELMLNSSSLKTVELQDTTYAIHQHLVSKDIRKLTIMLTGVLPHLLFSSVPSPGIEDLTLTCMNRNEGATTLKCCAIDMVGAWDGARIVKSGFPNLKALEIRCRCNCDKRLLWDLVRCLPKLEEIRIDDVCIPESVLRRLRQLKSVKIANLGTGLMLAHTVADSLTSLETREVVEEEDMQYDEIWTDLSSITIALGTGAEAAFLSGMYMFRNTLRTLRLSRSNYDEYHLQMREEAGLPCGEPENGVWLAMVESLPHLETLGFRNIPIEVEELVEIIKHVGERLQSLEITLEMRQEYALNRLERVLQTAAQHCPSLRNLFVEVGEFDAPDLKTELFYPDKLRWMAVMGRRLGRALEGLKRRSPFFDDEILKLFVRRLMAL